MDTLQTILGFIAFMVVATFAFIAYASSRPVGNPLRYIAGALAKRVGATIALTTVGLPLAFAPPVGDFVDLFSLVALAVYWIGFFRSLAHLDEHVPAPLPVYPPVINHDPADYHGTQMIPLKRDETRC